MIKLVAATVFNWIVVAIISSGVPARIATHFDGAGNANRWMTRSEFIGFSILFPLGMALFLVGLSRVVPLAGPQRLNVPNPGYWRSAANYPRAVAIVQQWMITFAAWMTIWLTAMSIVVVQSAQKTPPSLDAGLMIVLIGSFVIVMVVMILRLVWRFRVAA